MTLFFPVLFIHEEMQRLSLASPASVRVCVCGSQPTAPVLLVSLSLSAFTAASFSLSLFPVDRYFYYALAALGRQEVLWWKKYLTQMQMIQFVLIFMHALYFLSHSSCNWPKVFPVLEACHGLLFFYLFYSFYRKSYTTTTSPAAGAVSSPSSSSQTGDLGSRKAAPIAPANASPVRSKAHAVKSMDREASVKDKKTS